MEQIMKKPFEPAYENSYRALTDGKLIAIQRPVDIKTATLYFVPWFGTWKNSEKIQLQPFSSPTDDRR